jgi:hypothetical protein
MVSAFSSQPSVFSLDTSQISVPSAPLLFRGAISGERDPNQGWGAGGFSSDSCPLVNSFSSLLASYF